MHRRPAPKCFLGRSAATPHTQGKQGATQFIPADIFFVEILPSHKEEENSEREKKKAKGSSDP